MNKVNTLLDDPRSIHGVWWDNGREGYAVGHNEVTKIVPYQDYGNGAMVPWLAIYQGEHLLSRINVCALGVEITYASPPKQAPSGDCPSV